MGQIELSMGQKSESTGQNETGHSRARTPFSEGMSRLSHGTPSNRDGTQTVGQDNPSPVGVGASRPTDTPSQRQQEHKARLAADPRFAGWAAGIKA